MPFDSRQQSINDRNRAANGGNFDSRSVGSTGRSRGNLETDRSTIGREEREYRGLASEIDKKIRDIVKDVLDIIGGLWETEESQVTKGVGRSLGHISNFMEVYDIVNSPTAVDALIGAGAFGFSTGCAAVAGPLAATISTPAGGVVAGVAAGELCAGGVHIGAEYTRGTQEREIANIESYIIRLIGEQRLGGGSYGNFFSAFPIVIDLDSDGIELINCETSSVFFDWDGDGFISRTGWAAPDDGILVYDSNDDGKVDQASEISFLGYLEGAKTDLEGLRFFDSNHDGKIDAADSEITKFKIWQDKDQDGEVDAGEMVTLKEAGITSIGLTGAGAAKGENGNIVFTEATFTRTDGTTGKIGDVAFTYKLQDFQRAEIEDASTGTEIAGPSEADRIRAALAEKAAGLRDVGAMATEDAEEEDQRLGRLVRHVSLVSPATPAELLTLAAMGAIVATERAAVAAPAGAEEVAEMGTARLPAAPPLWDDGTGAANAIGHDLPPESVSAPEAAAVAGPSIPDLADPGVPDLPPTQPTSPSADNAGEVSGPASADPVPELGNGPVSLEELPPPAPPADAGSSGPMSPEEWARFLVGTEGDDLIIATATAPLEFAQGLGGRDTLVLDRTDDVTLDLDVVSFEIVYGSAGSDRLIRRDDTAVLLYGRRGDDVLSGGGGGDGLYGGSGHDRLEGNAGDDLLVGGTGGDVLSGGLGNDTAAYTASGAGVELDLASGVGRGGEAEGDRLAGIENLVGSGHADTLLGDAGSNVLDGRDGGDFLDGRDGDDVLAGGAGDDVLTGGLGADRLDGGAGEDLALYDRSGEGVAVDLATGTGRGGEAEGDRLVGIEHLAGSAHSDVLAGDSGSNRIRGGDGDDLLYGRAGDDWIEGNGGSDVLVGGLGADKLDGGAGEDTAGYADAVGGVSVDLAAGTGSGADAEGDRLVGIEHLVGSAHDDLLSGDSGSNHLDGGDGDDRLYGRDGDDVLVGSAGRDLLAGGAGGDRLEGGAGDDTLYGDAGEDQLFGSDGDDRLVGGAGADGLSGGAGLDIADYGASAAGVSIDLAAGTGRGGDAEGDRLSGIEIVLGSGHADELTGDAASNRLVGGDGDDVLEGGASADLLEGGAGRDRARYAGSVGAVQIDLAAMVALGGDAEGDVLSGIEDLEGSDFDDTLAGDDWANILIGNGGADALIGGAGDDILDGGAGDDVLAGGADADRLDGGEGVDLASYADSGAAVEVDLAAGTGAGGDAEGDILSGIEDLVGSAHDDVLAGNAGANRLDGGEGRDRLSGRDGVDVLVGGAGDDVLDGGSDDDQLLAGSGNDLLIGGLGADRLDGGDGRDRASYAGASSGVSVSLAAGVGTGGEAEGDVLARIEDLVGSAYADTLIGDNAANAIDGGDGADTLLGGDGDDTLSGNAGNDALWGEGGDDQIDGGTGTDTARYAGSFYGYRVERGATGAATVTDTAPTVNGDDGRDVLVNIERIEFADRTVWLDGTNNRPDARSDATTTKEDVGLVIRGADLLANDFDVDGDSLTITGVSGAINGAVQLQANGSIVFTPAAEFSGTAYFTYTVADGKGGTHTAKVSVEVERVSDAPAVVSFTESFLEIADPDGPLREVRIFGKDGQEITRLFDVSRGQLRMADGKGFGDTEGSRVWFETNQIRIVDAEGATSLYTVIIRRWSETDSDSSRLFEGSSIIAVYSGWGEAGLSGSPSLRLANDRAGDDPTGLLFSTAGLETDSGGTPDHTGWVIPDRGILASANVGNGWMINRSEILLADCGPGMTSLENPPRAFDRNGHGGVDAVDSGWDRFDVTGQGEFAGLGGPSPVSIGPDRQFDDRETSGDRIRGDVAFARTGGIAGNLDLGDRSGERVERQDSVPPSGTPADPVDDVALDRLIQAMATFSSTVDTCEGVPASSDAALDTIFADDASTDPVREAA